MDPLRSMKPLLAVAINEAVKLAIIDCCFAEHIDVMIAEHGVDYYLEHGDAVKAGWDADPYSIPDAYWSKIDIEALGQNVALRLLGPGGWYVGGVYAGNATAHEAMDAVVNRPHRSAVSEVAMDLLGKMEEHGKLVFDDDGEGSHEDDPEDQGPVE